ncbi:hypothetical protein IV203_025346 [Nitzschia inconspicua]|uniref:Uncharacterized protein n=1 Tax=Nitzschia inconspicua TaxID=303405 RepID=A0A9K3K9N0_9STRA|nr:hypothetical protein IV203_024843 [Nitzschia inconspicua]KAG7339610.1 hypothetical protein IV203_024649 [Nitzschia inconspicua]KAG7362462.1 hypothetical protein IV203_025346 [Nitzschia inconspicua]
MNESSVLSFPNVPSTTTEQRHYLVDSDTDSQSMILSTVSRVSSGLTLLCTLFLLHRSFQNRRINTFHRLVLAMSFHLMLYAILSLYGPAAAEANTTTRTALCAAQTFLLQYSGLAIAVYFASWSLYSHHVVFPIITSAATSATTSSSTSTRARRRQRRRRIQRQQHHSKYNNCFELFLHLAANGIPLVIALLYLFLQQTNLITITITGCTNVNDDDDHDDEVGPSNVPIVQWILEILPIVVVFLLPTLVMTIICIQVRRRHESTMNSLTLSTTAAVTDAEAGTGTTTGQHHLHVREHNNNNNNNNNSRSCCVPSHRSSTSTITVQSSHGHSTPTAGSSTTTTTNTTGPGGQRSNSRSRRSWSAWNSTLVVHQTVVYLMALYASYLLYLIYILTELFLVVVVQPSSSVTSSPFPLQLVAILSLQLQGVWIYAVYRYCYAATTATITTTKKRNTPHNNNNNNNNNNCSNNNSTGNSRNFNKRSISPQPPLFKEDGPRSNNNDIDNSAFTTKMFTTLEGQLERQPTVQLDVTQFDWDDDNDDNDGTTASQTDKRHNNNTQQDDTLATIVSFHIFDGTNAGGAFADFIFDGDSDDDDYDQHQTQHWTGDIQQHNT